MSNEMPTEDALKARADAHRWCHTFPLWEGYTTKGRDRDEAVLKTRKTV
jgi:hypothetical protein